MRTREQIEAELYNAKRHRDRTRDTIQQRLDQLASLRVMYAHYGSTLDRLLDELHNTPAQRDLGEAA
jgi:phage baseplate assembly protein W